VSDRRVRKVEWQDRDGLTLEQQRMAAQAYEHSRTGGLAMDVRMIIGGEDSASQATGALLHPSLDVIVGTSPHTPAAGLHPAALAELLGMRWATEAERREAEQLVLTEGAPAPGPVDGQHRRHAAS
jgi:hypothetical protein